MDRFADLLPLFVEEFKLCNLQPGEIVAVLSEPNTKHAYDELAMGAAAVLGAEVFRVSVPCLGFRKTPHRAHNAIRGNAQGIPSLVEPSKLRLAVREALLAADFIVDLTQESIGLVEFREEIQAAKKKLLTISEPPDMLERMFPSAELKAEVLALRDRFTAASEVRQTSPWGTDVRYDIAGVNGIAQYGMADVPGKWDNWPSGQVNIWPHDGSANGVAVIQRGCIVFPFKRYVETDVTITVEDGFIRAVEGGLDADLIRHYLESWEDPEVYAMAHISVGVHPRAQWSALPFYDKNEIVGMDARSARGGTLFTTGPNRFVNRMVQPHFDIACPGWNVYLDDEPVVLDGKLVEAALTPA
ncbi:MAG: hypothetical protein FJW96_11210 [Actinobacteria bacterium]|nr:hypothetical protein [Actinomycetota bacterium]